MLILGFNSACEPQTENMTIQTEGGVGVRGLSDGREVLLTRRRPARSRAAFGQHGDLSAEVVAVAADGGLLVLHVRAQEALQHPSAPLTLNLRLYFSIQKAVQDGNNEALEGAQNQIEHHPQLWVDVVRDESKNDVVDPKERYQQQRGFG